MSRCRQCQVIVHDDTQICPLCRCVLDQDGQGTNKYPDIWAKNHVLKLIIRIYLFVAIVVEALLVFINYRYFAEVHWSVIVGAILAYIYLTLAYTVSYSRAGYRMKMIVGVATAVLLLFLVDREMGNRGWSINYVLPAALLAMDVAILFLIIFNRKNWQSYIAFELVMILFSLIPVLMMRAGYITAPAVSYVPLAVSVCLFLGTMIIGGRRATTELRRKFHIK